MFMKGSTKMQTILLILPVLVAAVCCNPSMPAVDVPSKEEVVNILKPLKSKVTQPDTWLLSSEDNEYEMHQSGSDNQNPISTTTSTEAPAADESVPIDLSQRLFYANHLDYKFGHRTLDLSGLGLSGEDVMRILYSLNSTTLDHVTRLDLSHNQVWSLPTRVWPLHLEYSLRELHLDHNRLNTLDPDSRKATNFELCRLARLEKLSMSHNRLACRTRLSMPELEFPHNVVSLNLSNNHFAYIPMTLVGLRKLRHLDLSGNRIRSLDQGALPSLVGLYTLNLSSNGLQQPWGHIGWWDPLEKLVHLETLRLDNNLLPQPPRLAHFCKSYQPRTEVYISNNPLECSCYFNDTLDIGRVVIVDSANVTCVDDFGLKRSWNEPLPECAIPLLTQCCIQARAKWAAVKEWFHDNSPHYSTLFQLLGWVLFGVTITIVYTHRRAKKAAARPRASSLPYNVLDGRVGY